jgi:hypothetical protein
MSREQTLEDIEVATAALDILSTTLDDLVIQREGAYNKWKQTPGWRFIKKKRAQIKLAEIVESGNTVANMMINTFTCILNLQTRLAEYDEPST